MTRTIPSGLWRRWTRTSPTRLGVLFSLALTAAPTALAQGYSVDVEMLRPTFSPGSPPGVESPEIMGRGAVRAGLLYQYERDPVILRLYDEDAGSVIENRRAAHLGVSYDLSDRFSMRALLPLAYQDGTDNPEYAHEGLGVGDVSIGGRAGLASAGPLTTGLRADLLLPIGTRNAYLGEESFRAHLGLMGQVEFGPATLIADANFMTRPTTETGEDYLIESTIGLNTGAAVEIWPDRIALNTALLLRGGTSHLSERKVGENASEWTAGAMVRVPDTPHQVDLGVGKGLAHGVGTTAFRYFIGYTWVRPPEEPPPEPTVVVKEEPPPPEPELPDEVIEEPPPEEWRPEEKARIEQDQIVIRDPIQFEFATDRVLDESLPTLEAVADILNEHAEIGHIVIEGHASEEGSYEYNYDLSNLRARAVWKELIRAGVHPSRMSYRGMGEVVPKRLGDEEAALAANRRVEFHIVERFSPEDGYPVYPETTRLPWSGDTVGTTQPIQPAPPEPEEEEKTVEEQLEELLNPDDFDFDAFEGEKDGGEDEGADEADGTDPGDGEDAQPPQEDSP